MKLKSNIFFSTIIFIGILSFQFFVFAQNNENKVEIFKKNNHEYQRVYTSKNQYHIFDITNKNSNPIKLINVKDAFPNAYTEITNTDKGKKIRIYMNIKDNNASYKLFNLALEDEYNNVFMYEYNYLYYKKNLCN